MKIGNLKGHIPEKVLNEIPSVVEKFKINTPLRLAHFLAQCFHESNHFTATLENLNYSEAGLNTIFGKYFQTRSAKEYARKPEKIANLVYGNRMGNGDEKSGDGWKHRGAGYIQLTGKINQQSFFESIGRKKEEANAEEIASKYPLLSAAWFWEKNKLNDQADRGGTDLVVTDITKIVNGGSHGLPKRIKYFRKFHKIIAGDH